MINCIAQRVRFLDAENNVTLVLEPAEAPALAVRGDEVELPPIDGIPVVGSSPITEIRNVPEGDVIVPLVVAEGMRVLGHRHDGRVFTPQPLRFGPDRAAGPLGTPGLIYHADISEVSHF